MNAAATLEFNPAVRPFEYFGNGDRVVVLGDEIFRVKETGATHQAEWTWVYDVRDGRIDRVVAIEHLGGVADLVAEALSKAKEEAAR